MQNTAGAAREIAQLKLSPKSNMPLAITCRSEIVFPGCGYIHASLTGHIIFLQKMRRNWLPRLLLPPRQPEPTPHRIHVLKISILDVLGISYKLRYHISDLGCRIAHFSCAHALELIAGDVGNCFVYQISGLLFAESVEHHLQRAYCRQRIDDVHSRILWR